MYKSYFAISLLIVFSGLSYQRPSEKDTQVIPSNALAALSPLATLESLPATDLIKELIIRHNEIADTVVPIMVRVLINPVPGLADTLQRSLALFGVSSYLVGPSFVRSARTLGPVVAPLVGPTDTLIQKIDRISELEPLFEQALNIFGINNDECREALTCQAGASVASDYPLIATYISQLAVATRPMDDKFAQILLKIMNSSDPKCPTKCPNLDIIEKYWKESGEKDLATVAQDAFAGTINNALSSLLPEVSENAISTRAAQCSRSTDC